MEHLTKLLRDSYDLQEQEPEKSAYWHLQQLRSEIKQLALHDVVSSLPNYKETKIECKKQLKEMNESYALGTLRSYEKRFFTSGFIRCYLFMKGKR